MARAPLAPLTLGARTIPLAYPPLSLRISLVQTWADLTPDVGDAPLALQHQLAFAALGLAWEAAHRAATVPMEPPPTTLAAHGYDLLRYGAAVGDAFDADDAIDGAVLIRQADTVASAILATVTVGPEMVKSAEALAVFSEARPGPVSAPGFGPLTAGSATPSAGTV